MSVRHVLTEVFLWLGVALLLLAAVGIVTLRNAFDRLHLPGLAAVGALCVAVAIVIEKSFSLVGDEALLTAAVSRRRLAGRDARDRPRDPNRRARRLASR